jgi:hypothetical protein
MAAVMSWVAMYTLVERLVPPALRQAIAARLEALLQWLLGPGPSMVQLKIPKHCEGYSPNHLYRHSLEFLSSLGPALSKHKQLNALLLEDEEEEEEEYGGGGGDGGRGRIQLRLPCGVEQPLEDEYEGVRVKWRRKREKKGEPEESGGSADSDSDSSWWFFQRRPRGSIARP